MCDIFFYFQSVHLKIRPDTDFFFVPFAAHRKQVMSTAAEAERDGVKVPTTLAEYCVQTRVPSQDSSSDLLYDDLYDDDMEEEDEEDDESEMESVGEAGAISAMEEGGTSTRCYDNQDDSGNEDS